MSGDNLGDNCGVGCTVIDVSMLYRADGDQQEEGCLHQGTLADGLAQEDGPTWTRRIVVYG